MVSIPSQKVQKFPLYLLKRYLLCVPIEYGARKEHILCIYIKGTVLVQRYGVASEPLKKVLRFTGTLLVQNFMVPFKRYHFVEAPF